MNIVAAMTDGDIASLRPGKNGLFYDLEENEWNATVTRIVDNPINLGQAFWAPYRKAGQFCAGLLNKSAAEKDAKGKVCRSDCPFSHCWGSRNCTD